MCSSRCSGGGRVQVSSCSRVESDRVLASRSLDDEAEAKRGRESEGAQVEASVSTQPQICSLVLEQFYYTERYSLHLALLRYIFGTSAFTEIAMGS